MTVPTIRIKVLRKPLLKGKMNVKFPAKIIGEGGINAEVQNGNVVISPSLGVLGDVTGPGPNASVSGQLAVFTDGNNIDGSGATKDDLLSVAGLAATGVGFPSKVSTGPDVWTARSIVGTANEITVTNGNGSAGNPTLSIPTAVTFTGKTVTGGTFVNPSIATIVNTGTLTLPTATDTLVGRATTDTLTNKTFNATNNLVSNLTTSMFATNTVDTDATLTANSDTRLASQKAVKSYIDNGLTGLSWKAAVTVATTANITLSGEQTVDGILTSASRVLVKNQTTGSQNGIYLSSSGSWTRSTDMDTGTEFVSAAVFIKSGTVNADTQWTCTNDSVTVGTTAVVFAQVSGAGTYSAGTGLALSGNQFAIDGTVATLTGAQTLTNKSLTSPTMTGTPVAPTAAVDTNTTQVATTAMVLAQAASATPLGSMATAAVGTATRFARSDHVHPGREALTANRTYFVLTTGSDSNTGLANTAGGAFRNPQKAYDVIVSNLDLSGFAITVQIGDGTYTTGVNVSQPWTGGGSITFQGNSSTPANVLISTTSAGCFSVGGSLPSLLTIKDMKLQTATSGNSIFSNAVGQLNFGNIVFGACAGFQIYTTGSGVTAQTISAYSIVGGGVIHGLIQNGAALNLNHNVTLTGTPAFTIFIQANSLATVQSLGTYTGSATGQRYNVTDNAVLNTNGAGISYLPGSTAGAGTNSGTSPFGRYV